MPLGKYYCDYCDKQFQDTPAARKRHLQGLHHHRARALWYDSFKGIFSLSLYSYILALCLPIFPFALFEAFHRTS